MSRLRWILPAVALLAALAVALQPGTGDETAKSGTDVPLQVRIDEAWAQIARLLQAGDASAAASLQRRTAAECYDHFVKHPDDETGANAVATAIKMWGNLGEDRRIDEVLPEIDPGTAIWRRIVHHVRTAYLKAGRGDEYYALLEEWKDRLTHPLARSQVLLYLADHHASLEHQERAAAYYRQLLELGADPLYVENARKALYELEVLVTGRPAPDFEAKDVQGRTVSLSRLRGKVVVLEFWATFCAPCLPEIEHLKKLRAAHPSSDLEIIGISFDRNLARLRDFLTRRGMDWPQLCDGRGWEGEIPGLYNTRVIPRSFVIDRDGKLAAIDHRGDVLAAVVERLLATKREPSSPGGPVGR